MPIRAAYGGLPGVLQSVGRAERVAGLRAVQLFPGTMLIVSDLHSFVQEGRGWNPRLASSRGTYPGVWRSLFHAAEEKGVPDFAWVPSHLTIDGALEKRISVLDVQGNAWADYFARLGALSHALPEKYVDGFDLQVGAVQSHARFLGLAVARIAELGLWSQERGERPPSGPRAALLNSSQHQFVRFPDTGEVRCKECNRSACTELTLRTLRNRSHGLCEPTPERRLGAALYLEDARRRGRFFHEGADAMVGLALLVASALHVDGEEAEPGEPPEGVVVPIPPIDMSCFSERGHQVVQVGHALVCRCCASFSPRLRVSPTCKLRSVCTGFSREKRLKKAQLAALAKVLSGFHPKTGASLVSPPHPASSSSAPPPLPPPPQEVQGESPPPTVG